MDMLMFSTVWLQHWWEREEHWLSSTWTCAKHFSLSHTRHLVSGVGRHGFDGSGLISVPPSNPCLTQSGLPGRSHSELRTAAHCPAGGQGQAAFLRGQHWMDLLVTPLLVTQTEGLSAPSGEVSEGKVGRGWNKIIFKIPSNHTIL